MFVYSLACNFEKNDKLYSWLNENGINSSDHPLYGLDVSILFRVKKLTIALDVERNKTAHPNLSNFYGSISIGKSIRFNDFYLIPLFGLGQNTSTIALDGTVPRSFSNLKVSDNSLIQNEIFLHPHIDFIKASKKNRSLFGLEIGCMIYTNSNQWDYGRTYQVQAPNFSEFHPYCSVNLGLQNWNYRVK